VNGSNGFVRAAGCCFATGFVGAYLIVAYFLLLSSMCASLRNPAQITAARGAATRVFPYSRRAPNFVSASRVKNFDCLNTRTFGTFKPAENVWTIR
jgi:hypothetical protein